jgi:hypothetical protein
MGDLAPPKSDQETSGSLVQEDVSHSRGLSGAIVVCLTVGLLLSTTGAGLAISGLASTGPAVGAQYPDSQSFPPDAKADPNTAGRSLVTLQKLRDDPSKRGSVAERKAEASVIGREVEAIARPSRSTAAEFGSMSLLLSGIAVMSIGGLLRWRRGSMAPSVDG